MVNEHENIGFLLIDYKNYKVRFQYFNVLSPNKINLIEEIEAVFYISGVSLIARTLQILLLLQIKIRPHCCIIITTNQL